jgi:formylmethanofuran dehydrogenase subunit E
MALSWDTAIAEVADLDDMHRIEADEDAANTEPPAIAACADCGELLYTSDEVFGPYLGTGGAVFCGDCAGRATRGVV